MASESGNTKTTSQKKVEANRQNAQLSTGPTSAQGKKISSRNALKYGLLVKDVVITTRGNKEDPAEFEALLAELRDSYRPGDMAEDLLVRELAISYWKSARALRYERGEVTCADAAPNESEVSESEITTLSLVPAADAYHSQLRSSRGIKFLLRKIEEAQDEVRVSGSLSAELRRWLDPATNWERISHLGTKQLLAALQKTTEQLTAKKGLVEENESQWRSDQRDCSAIPSKPAVDRIHRYETSNVRHRYRVEARLDQLQARPSRNAKVNSGGCSDAESHQDIQFFETNPTGSGEPPVRQAGARVATPEEQVAQEESVASPDPNPTGSPTDGTGAAGTDARLEAEQWTPLSIDATAHRQDGAESASDGSGEAEKA